MTCLNTTVISYAKSKQTGISFIQAFNPCWYTNHTLLCNIIIFGLLVILFCGRVSLRDVRITVKLYKFKSTSSECDEELHLVDQQDGKLVNFLCSRNSGGLQAMNYELLRYEGCLNDSAEDLGYVYKLIYMKPEMIPGGGFWIQVKCSFKSFISAENRQVEA